MSGSPYIRIFRELVLQDDWLRCWSPPHVSHHSPSSKIYRAPPTSLLRTACSLGHNTGRAQRRRCHGDAVIVPHPLARYQRPTPSTSRYPLRCAYLGFAYTMTGACACWHAPNGASRCYDRSKQRVGVRVRRCVLLDLRNRPRWPPCMLRQRAVRGQAVIGRRAI